MKFIVLPSGTNVPPLEFSTGYLKIDHWNDYSFVSSFDLEVVDELGELHSLGYVKIGYTGQTSLTSTHSTLGNTFDQLPNNYFSLGQDVGYYSRISSLSVDLRTILLNALNDIVFSPELINTAINEEVFRVSLLREISLSIIKGQFSRVLAGHPPLTNYSFKFARSSNAITCAIELDFNVEIASKPSTNIHAIIGRNGVGKTTLLNGMTDAITREAQADGKFYDTERFGDQAIGNDYFSSLVSVSFSAFDGFKPPSDQINPSLGACYFYIGLKKEEGAHKTRDEIDEDFIQALKACFRQKQKKERWLKLIDLLESDENFACLGLKDLASITSVHDELDSKARQVIKITSSGHAIVLLTITRLVATVEEKTLVLIDEPESHLHPPLLSAFIRALSELLLDRNGVAIIATHSPVVLQEVPKSCVWKLNRVGILTDSSRPSIETFGENVGILTREVFGLEVVRSGFHDLLVESVKSGNSYQEIVTEYKNQLGLEARAMLKTLVTYRERAGI